MNRITPEHLEIITRENESFRGRLQGVVTSQDIERLVRETDNSLEFAYRYSDYARIAMFLARKQMVEERRNVLFPTKRAQ